MKDKLAETPDALGIRALYVCMSEECVENVVSCVLNYLGRASPESKRVFQTELDKLNLRVPGFRNASRAPAHMLTTPVQRALPLSDNLAGAALKVWAESHQPLREIVLERINDVGTYIGVSEEYPDFSGNRLKGQWPKDPWEREFDRFTLLHDDFDEDDIALMMCYVSGKLPGMTDSEEEPDPVSEAVMQSPAILKLLALCVVDLENLPASAPEWKSEIPVFAGKIDEIVSAKEEERNSAVNLDAAIADIGNEFSSELAYLESNTDSWRAASLSPNSDIAEALSISEKLHSLLTEYHALRESPPASSRSEERSRRDKNDELEDRILRLLDSMDSLMSSDSTPDDDPPGQGRQPESHDTQPKILEQAGTANTPDETPAPVSGPSAEHGASLGSAATVPDLLAGQVEEAKPVPREDYVSLQSERDGLRLENDSLRSEVQRLETENQSLRLDKNDLRGENDSLRAELSESRSDAEIWRIAYEEERKIPRLTLEDVPPHIKDVGDAVKYAGDMFRDKLLLKPNSKSEVRDNPFEKPEDVWGALEWLATTYHKARVGESSVPDFDLSIREACGWQYKSGQYDTTMNKYRDWYTTKANGKTYRLAEHIAKGTSKDARHTIRIAFDWDKDEKLVVVGFIGQHQQTGAT